MKKNKCLSYLFATLCIALSLFLLLSSRFGMKTGHLQVHVMDAYTFVPIPFASVCLPESDLRTETNEAGTAVFTEIPVCKSSCGNLPKPEYGETTILVYAKGYLPFALFHAQVFPGTVRNGPNVYLFPEESENGLDAVSMIESPPQEYVKAILERYSLF